MIDIDGRIMSYQWLRDNGIEFADIVDSLPEAALYELLAEECAEAAQAALKTARTLRGENPTPVSFDDAARDCRLEYSDLVHVAMAIGLFADLDYIRFKNERWRGRILADGKSEN